MGELLNHAKREFKIKGWDETCSDGMQKHKCEHILKLLEVFSDEGHSGSSASYAISLFNRLVNFKPISALTGDDSEWMEINDNLYQNIRCSSVFKDSTGKTWDIDNDRKKVVFPYFPESN